MTDFVTDIRIAPALWASSLFPEGILEKWLRPDGAEVKAGDALATIRIEDARHELLAPASGRLRTDLREGSLVDPGMPVGRITH
jgi:pyruvate/2-oxoglutarate dehydrogenase complex dihydrolipoamide acyltransferase (E2) component